MLRQNHSTDKVAGTKFSSQLMLHRFLCSMHFLELKICTAEQINGQSSLPNATVRCTPDVKQTLRTQQAYMMLCVVFCFVSIFVCMWETKFNGKA